MFVSTLSEGCGCSKMAHRVIGGPVVWPPMSPDLTILGCYMWGSMESLLCAVMPSIRAELLNHIIVISVDIINDQNSFWRFVTCILRRATMCVDGISALTLLA